MKHEILGEINLSNVHPCDATAIVSLDSRNIEFILRRDGHPLEVTLALAADVAKRLTELDQRAKRVAALQLCDTYNGGWNEYHEYQEDGSYKTVKNPQLSIQEFEAKLSLKEVGVSGDSELDFYYDDEYMFWGHCIVVNSLSGIDLTDATAELFG